MGEVFGEGGVRGKERAGFRGCLCEKRPMMFKSISNFLFGLIKTSLLLQML